MVKYVHNFIQKHDKFSSSHWLNEEVKVDYQLDYLNIHLDKCKYEPRSAFTFDIQELCEKNSS